MRLTTTTANVFGFSLALALLATSAARPQVGPVEPSPPPPCTERQPSDVVSAWSLPAVAGQSGHDANEARSRPLVLDKPNKIALVTRDSARFPVVPGGAEQPRQYMYAGIIGFHVPRDGTYRVVTDEGMRIDVVVGGRLVDSTAFGRGPHCSGKFVDFPLHMGDATLQLVGAPYETVTVLILPRP